jgi:hypothetical protein
MSIEKLGRIVQHSQFGGDWENGKATIFQSSEEALEVGIRHVDKQGGWQGTRWRSEAITRSMHFDIKNPRNIAALTPRQLNKFEIGTAMLSLIGSIPTVFVGFSSIPKDFNKEDYFAFLTASLIANGLNKDIVVKEYSMLDDIKAWWNNSPTGMIVFRKMYHNEDIDVGGFSNANNPRSIVIYDLKNVSMDNYIQATLHEIGHAFFGFNHDPVSGHGIGPSATAPTVMDYRYVYNVNQGFNADERAIISNSIWGN